MWNTQQCLSLGRARSHGGHAVSKAPLGNRMPAFFHPSEFFAIAYCSFIFCSEGRSPDILIELNLGLCEILEA